MLIWFSVHNKGIRAFRLALMPFAFYMVNSASLQKQTLHHAQIGNINLSVFIKISGSAV